MLKLSYVFMKTPNSVTTTFPNGAKDFDEYFSKSNFVEEIMTKQTQILKEQMRADELLACAPFAEMMFQLSEWEPIRNSIWRYAHNHNVYAVCVSSDEYDDSESGDILDWAWKIPFILRDKLQFVGYTTGPCRSLAFGAIKNTNFVCFILTF